MIYRSISLVFIFFTLVGSCYCQQYKVEGHLKDANTGDPLIGTVISVPAKNIGVAADEKGYFSLSLAKDSVTFVFESLGYSTQKKTIFLDRDYVINLAMAPSDEQLEEVVIKKSTTSQTLENTQMSVATVDSKDAKLIPVFFGEVDLLKTLQLKPGIQSGSEGSPGLYVRGGGPDQNLVLMDEAVVYNASHLFGFFSLFNPDAVSHIDLYKGNFPSQYSGRLSSVVDVKLTEGNKEKLTLKGGIGLIASRLSLEGPIRKKKSSFIISGRRTYMDLYTPTINRLNEKKPNFDPIPGYYFYDINAKVSFDLGPKDKLFSSGYFGRDAMDLSNRNFSFKLNWGNITSSTQWQHIFNEKLSARTYLLFSQYQYNSENKFRTLLYRLQSKINDYTAKTDFTYFANDKHLVKFGTSFTYHYFNIGKARSTNDGNEIFGSGNEMQAGEMGLYISDELTLTPRWSFNNGLRLSGFVNEGKFFHGLEPRVSSRFLVNENFSIKGSFSRMYQYLHLASNSGASLPNDIWYPANNSVKPQRSDQVAGGFNFYLFNKKFMLSNEVYYKWMKNQIDIKEGANILDLPDIDEGFAVGKGWAYGDEIFLEKKEGKTTGWVGYTLSWTWKKFAEINDGNTYPSRYDRRHNVSVVVMHKLSKRLILSGSWVFSSGNAITLPQARFVFQDVRGIGPSIGQEFLPRNSYRMPSYHRMDLGLVWKLNPKRGESDLTFSLYNVYNRRNPYLISFEEVKDPSGKFVERYKAKQVSLFPVIPSITYNFKF
ncbi:MAG TPA: TonB-dependent receptor [Cytophagaceae bacterium]|jgi:hypothetical protein